MKKILGALLLAALVLSVFAPAAQADNDGGEIGTAIWLRDFGWKPPAAADCDEKVYTFIVKARPGTQSMRPRTRLQATIIKEDMVFPKMVKAKRQGNKLVWRVRLGKADLVDAWVRVSGSGVSAKRLPARLVCGVIAPPPQP